MIVDCKLDEITRNELGIMCYARWSQEFDHLKRVRSMIWEDMRHVCPKADWPEHHKMMLDKAEDAFRLAAKVRDDVCKYAPLALGH